MLLDTEDTRALETYAARENRLKRLIPLIVAGELVLAAVLFLYLGEESNGHVIAIGLAAVSLISAFALRTVFDRGAGSASSVLAGRSATRTVTATVTKNGGRQPYPWSLTLDEELNGRRYVHLSVREVKWTPELGQRCQLSGFGEERAPFRGVAVLTVEGSPAKHWFYSVAPSTSEQYSQATS